MYSGVLLLSVQNILRIIRKKKLSHLETEFVTKLKRGNKNDSECQVVDHQRVNWQFGTA